MRLKKTSKWFNRLPMKQQLDGNFTGKSLTASKMQSNQHCSVDLPHCTHLDGIWNKQGLLRNWGKGFAWSQKQNSHLLTHPPLYPQPRRKGGSSHFPLWVWPHLVHPLLYSASGQVWCLWLGRELTRRNWFVYDHMKLMSPSWQLAFQHSRAYCRRSQSSPQVTG